MAKILNVIGIYSLYDVKIQILEYILKLKSTIKHRKTSELHWIYQLKTLESIGLNNMEKIHEILAFMSQSLFLHLVVLLSWFC